MFEHQISLVHKVSTLANVSICYLRNVTMFRNCSIGDILSHSRWIMHFCGTKWICLFVCLFVCLYEYRSSTPVKCHHISLLFYPVAQTMHRTVSQKLYNVKFPVQDLGEAPPHCNAEPRSSGTEAARPRSRQKESVSGIKKEVPYSTITCRMALIRLP